LAVEIIDEGFAAPEPTTPEDPLQWAAWQPSTPYTVGLEDEVMLLDPGTWRLAQRADEVLAIDEPTDTAALALREALSGWFGTHLKTTVPIRVASPTR
jgi:hypothetical protein